jgi:hypothetical protein
MFDYATARPTRLDSSRLATISISLAAHILVIAAVAIPVLFATNVLPPPPTMMAFVVDAAPSLPPPPPPPPAPDIKSPTPAKPRRTTPVHRQVAPAKASVPTPIEAPTDIAA